MSHRVAKIHCNVLQLSYLAAEWTRTVLSFMNIQRRDGKRKHTAGSQKEQNANVACYLAANCSRYSGCLGRVNLPSNSHYLHEDNLHVWVNTDSLLALIKGAWCCFLNVDPNFYQNWGFNSEHWLFYWIFHKKTAGKSRWWHHTDTWSPPPVNKLLKDL